MGNLIDLEQVVSRISTATTVEASSVEVNVFKPARPMATVYADQELNEPKLLSEINEHLIDTYGRTTGVRTSPIEALALSMMMIETDVPVDGIIAGDASGNMSTSGILVDLERVHPCATSTKSAASTAPASSVVVYMHVTETVTTEFVSNLYEMSAAT
jgi:hypothetical protein